MWAEKFLDSRQWNYFNIWLRRKQSIINLTNAFKLEAIQTYSYIVRKPDMLFVRSDFY